MTLCDSAAAIEGSDIEGAMADGLIHIIAVSRTLYRGQMRRTTMCVSWCQNWRLQLRRRCRRIEAQE